MPNRIIKESICTSASVEKLTNFEEVFFYRLIVSCDDYGCFDARPEILKARLFPLRKVSEKQIESALSKLSKVEIIKLYLHDEKSFLQFATWGNHQQIRARRHKYPAFDDTCDQLISDDSICAPNPIQSNPNPIRIRIQSISIRALFLSFWEKYPKKIKKTDAEAAFVKINPDEALLSDMLKSVAEWEKSDQWQDSQFIPYPATWLNKRQWEDEVPKPTGKKVDKPKQNFEGVQYSEEFLKTLEVDPDELLKKFQERKQKRESEGKS